MTVELLKGRGKLRRLLCSLLAALMLLPWVMQGAWAAGGTREVKSREIAVVFDNSGSMYDAGNTAVSAVNGSAVGSIKVGTLVFNRDPATGKLVSTKKTATTEIGNNRACNVSGQVLDSTGIPVPMSLGVTLKFSK